MKTRSLLALALSTVLAVGFARGAAGPAQHDDKLCAGCSAEAIWKAFLEHLKAEGKADLIPPNALPVEPKEAQELKAEGEPGVPAELGRDGVDLLAGDPIKGILFQLSPDLVNLDAMFSDWGAEAKPPTGEALEKAKALAAKLKEAKDPYLAAYGVHFGARLDVAAGECPKAVAALEGLVKSCYFLPRRLARKTLAQAYTCTGDDTLALLEYRLFQVDLPAEDETERAWADGEIKAIREKEHPGPLHHSESSMKEISVAIGDLSVGEPTQARTRRVEDILDKVARLLEEGGACSNGSCPGAQAGRGQQEAKMEGQGQGQGKGRGKGRGQKPGNELAKGKGKGKKPGQEKGEEDGETKSSKAGGKAARKTNLEQQDGYEPHLKDLTPQEKDAWGKINDREVARSLRGLWDKIPRSYRTMVTQYFRELSEPEADQAGGAAKQE